MSVDLDRLREAADYIDKEWSGELWDASTALRARPVLREAHQAVLDAPTRWVCKLGLDYARGVPERCRFDSLGKHEGCGWVALVPVKGGQE